MSINAKWIEAPIDIGTVSPEFKKDYTISSKIKKATAKVSANGVYNFYVNGAKVGNALMAPGWTSYKNQIQYQTYDITKLLTKENSFSILAGNGWAVGRVGCGAWGTERNNAYSKIAVIAEIEIIYKDGTVELIPTDESWDVYTSKILFSELYDGETIDLTAPITHCGSAKTSGIPCVNLVSQIGEFVIEHERVAPINMFITPKGEKVIDFGQNLAGYAEFKVKGNPGDKIVVTHAEVLDKDGNFYTENLRTAKNTNTYILDGEERIFKPHFCFQGFRYIRLDEYPFDEVDLSSITAVVIYSDIKRTGEFSCGYEKLNRLYSNIIWGQRSNFIDVPTDCPQRDERLGWTGDAQVFCRTAAINYDVERFFKKWLSDMTYEQTEKGGIHGIVPLTSNVHTPRISTAWADASVICPWEIYRAYGNDEILRDNYDMMKKWIEYMHSFGEDEYLFVGGNHYGDWLAMDAGDGSYYGATQSDLVASAYFAFSTELVVKIGKILGEDTTYHENLYKNIRAAFRASFMKDGLPVIYPKADAFAKNRPVKALTQTAIVLILRFGLCEDNERELLINTLVKLIEENDGRMTTGFVGTPHILHALSANGRIKEAYDLLLQEKNPSWLFSVNHGATTVWEHWDSVNDKGEFWSTDMNSFNHYAYGSVYDWMFGVMLGITVDENDGAGYAKIIYVPKPDRRIGFAKGSVESRLGKVESSWTYLEDGRVRYELTVPAGCEATVRICGVTERTVSGGTFVFIV